MPRPAPVGVAPALAFISAAALALIAVGLIPNGTWPMILVASLLLLNGLCGVWHIRRAAPLRCRR